jgi:HD superfamily phosphohydrolase
LKRSKIFNDPVYGFISLQSPKVFEIVEHPWFQRLRRIKQLGLSSYVYPGAIHTRFQHALGTVHLMQQALGVLSNKGNEITEEEAEAACIAILLHEIGHGPYSHALEHSLADGIDHEALSLQFMEALNIELGGMEMAISIFKGEYHKRFLHQLVSSQLDVDRLDYLTRDTYFTGVHEGKIGWNRIIDMMDVKEDELVIEAKGIYSIEKFIIARRIMYWQVYLHKTVLCAEQMLIKTIKRARALAGKGVELNGTPPLLWMMYEWPKIKKKEEGSSTFLQHFANLDDTDILSALKSWQFHEDKVLAHLSSAILHRKLFKIKMQNEAFEIEEVNKIKTQVAASFELNSEELEYMCLHDETSNAAYNPDFKHINILYKDGSIKDVAAASDQLNIRVLSDPVIKHYICYPKN